MTVAGDLVDVLVAALEQAAPEQRARLRAALGIDEPISPSGEIAPAVYTPATLAASSAARLERSEARSCAASSTPSNVGAVG